MVGRLTSLPMTFAGALALGLVQELTNVTWLWPEGDLFLRIRLALPGLFLIAAVLLVPSFRLSAGRIVGRDQPRVPTVRRSALAGAVLVAVVVTITALGPADLQPRVGQALVMATIALSLVALTGLSGQVSLTQYLFVGLGAFVAGKAFGGDSVLGMLLGGVVAAGMGVLAAVPAVRLRGLHLALSTFGVALVGREVVLGDHRVFGLSGISVHRPDVLGFSTTSDAAFATWSAIVFVALAVVVVALRRSWFGRQLTALRDSELAAATLGMRVQRAKVAIFAVSGFIAGCAGSLFGGLQGAVDGIQFEPVSSLVIVLFAFVGGITTVTGAAIAGTLFALLAYVEATFPDLAGLVFVGVAAAAIGLGRQPNGLAGILYSATDRLDDLRRQRTPSRHRTARPAAVPALEGSRA
jgi:branched-chain amino acid transport system permease protein